MYDLPNFIPPEEEQKPKKKPKKHKDRFICLNTFVDVKMRDVKGQVAKLVWFVLYRDTKSDGTVQAAQSDIARRVNCSVIQVKRAIKGLVSLGAIVVVRTGNNITHEAAIYRIIG